MDGTAIKAMMAEIAPVLREYVGNSLAPIVQRLEALEGRPAPDRGEKGEPGVGIADATKTDGVLILRLTDGSEKQVGPVDGKDGEPGPMPDEDAIRAAVAEPIAAAVAAAVAELPPAERGEKGEQGESGASPEPEAVAEVFRTMAEGIVDDAIATALAKLPPPEKGEKGDPGEPGRDGCGVSDLLMDHEGALVATFDDGRMKAIGPVRGRDGADGKDGRDGLNGKDGRDGFSLEDFDCRVLEDDRTIEFSFASGAHQHVAALKWPTMIYRGVFHEGRTYERGDTVTWGGELWHCERATDVKPVEGADWRRAVRKGRDGKGA